MDKGKFLRNIFAAPVAGQGTGSNLGSSIFKSSKEDLGMEEGKGPRSRYGAGGKVAGNVQKYSHVIMTFDKNGIFGFMS